ncbi:MAG: LytTR family transcriptional regulator [Prevotella sp.]|nr:LytTR family transcriptional regulator [Prevotella sp.]
MNKGHKETISTRFISTVFMVLAIAIFKPFGLEMWQWQASVHRAFLVNLGQVEQIISHSGSTQLLIKHCHESLPVSRSNMAQVRAAITL